MDVKCKPPNCQINWLCSTLHTWSAQHGNRWHQRPFRNVSEKQDSWPHPTPMRLHRCVCFYTTRSDRRAVCHEHCRRLPSWSHGHQTDEEICESVQGTDREEQLAEQRTRTRPATHDSELNLINPPYNMALCQRNQLYQIWCSLWSWSTGWTRLPHITKTMQDDGVCHLGPEKTFVSQKNNTNSIL